MQLERNRCSRRADDDLFATPFQFIMGNRFARARDASLIGISQKNVRFRQTLFAGRLIIQKAEGKKSLIATQIHPMTDAAEMRIKRVITPAEKNFARRTPCPPV